MTLFIIVRTLCCWSSFDPGCSFWRQWKDWTRRQAGSSRPHVAHIHNHCRTTVHPHGTQSISACKKGHIVIRSAPYIPALSISLLLEARGLSRTDTHHYYVLIKAAFDKCVTAMWSSVWKHTMEGCLLPFTGKADSHMPASISNHNIIYIWQSKVSKCPF